jgi:membrane protein DedA with SNARE-associated domain
MAAVGTLVATYGVWAVLLGTFLEGETVLVLGGFAARRGYLDPWAVALAGRLGAFGVPHGRFALLDLVGAAFWSALVTLGGYAFGMAFEGLVEHGARYEIVAILLIAALGAAAWTVHFLRKRRRR